MYYPKSIVGKCDLCGGKVSVPTVWHCINPPTAQCEKCGAFARSISTIPIIPMEPISIDRDS